MNLKESNRDKIKKRALFIQKIRSFFEQRNILEVDTALLRPYTVSDPYMSAFSVANSKGKHCGFLQTSPEYAMKKLISQGSGDIFQLSKMFRADEKSPIHAGEFTMLEWYRMGYDHLTLIDEVCELVEWMLGEKERVHLTYQQAFISILGFDPFEISYQQLFAKTQEKLGEIPTGLLFDNYLSLLFSEKVESQFNPNKITIVDSFPASQASLAKTKMENGVELAERFEVYLNGMELANGFNELTDPEIQRNRFVEDNRIREQLGYNSVEIDESFLKALGVGIPNCAGVALGVDRLMMISFGAKSIEEVLIA